MDRLVGWLLAGYIEGTGKHISKNKYLIYTVIGILSLCSYTLLDSDDTTIIIVSITLSFDML